MMEVKQNTAVDLNDLLTETNNSGQDEVDDAVMTDLTDGTHELVNCDLIKTNDKSVNIAELGNGDVAMASLLDDVDVGAADLNATVNSELEDALLAEDDVLPKITTTKAKESIPIVATIDDDILADKVETSNSTTSSNNVRDPGDDLDTLLSKINDIVEDCIDNESENTVLNTLNADQVINEIKETAKENNLSKSSIFTEASHVIRDSKLIETDKLVETSKTINSANEEALGLNGPSKIATDGESLTAADALMDVQEVSKTIEDETDENNETVVGKSVVDESVGDKTAVTDSVQSLAEKKSDIVKISHQGTSDKDSLTKCDQKQVQTEKSTPVAVQDNAITSNSEELPKAIKLSSSPSKIDAKETSPSQEAKTNGEAVTSADDVTANEEKTTTQADDSAPLKSSENDDSDDEIVFYVDKPPVTEKSKTVMMQIEKETGATPNENSEKQKDTSPVKSTVEDDDDVVLLLDDDDEEEGQVKKDQVKGDFSEKQQVQKATEDVNTSVKVTKEATSKDIGIDNSDNACDDFVVAENSNENEKSLGKTEVAETPEETNSNCSSSSNLLQESKSVKTTADETATEEAENENEEEEDDGEVEVVESELKGSETLEKNEDSELSPPAKRIRLSEDSEGLSKAEESTNQPNEADSPKKQESNVTQSEGSESTCSALKRSHDAIAVETEEKSNDSKISGEGTNKKYKTETESTEKFVVIEDEKTSEDMKSEIEDKKDIKAIPSYEPIPLYPPPKFEALKSVPAISLEFLKKFRKSFDNMTKQDLEDLVLQKVVEAIIHRSEFSEMRELIEKQEKLITAHRTKISELSKQFRDLEMVHSRVVKDIEQRNSQFIMPVKITRAVGLQVYIPNKKSLAESTATGIGANVSSSPQRPATSQASNASSSLTPPQRLFLSSQSETQQSQRPGTTAAPGPGGIAGNVRRGCVQKITPIRPVPGANSAAAAGTSSAAAAYRSTPNHSAAAQPRLLNKSATSTTPNPTSIQRARYLASNQDGQRMATQQQISRTPNVPTSGQRTAAASAAAQPKSSPNVATTVPRRSDPLSPGGTTNSSSSIVDNYINTLTHLTGGNTAVSITPAKPKEKAVIDLTDEDETAGQSPSTQPASHMPVTQVPRRNLPAQNSANSQLQYGRAAPPMARIPPANQMANNKNRQMSSSLQAQKNSSFSSINTPPGTSITRISVTQNASNVQRVKYSHPAPLPATPPQAFNPAWKLPPPRPTIRISNLDNGIVISWTMEESMDRHAECVSYQIYAYQETSGPPMVDSWRHVGDVKAMLLPMAVTLTQFQEGQRYYFAVRAVDCHQRFGPFSLPKTWN